MLSQSGKIYLKDQKLSQDDIYNFVYEPAKGFSIYEAPKVVFITKTMKKQSVPLIKYNDSYEFKVKIPDSLHAFIAVIYNNGKKVMDNDNKGYVLYLKNNTKEDKEKSKLEALSLCFAGNFLLKLKNTPQEILVQYEELFEQNASLKQSSHYINYLGLKYRNDKSVESEVLVYAEILASNEDENSLKNALNLFSLIKKKEKAEALKTEILEKYPKGELAQGQFITKFFKEKNKTEAYILDAHKDYVSKFGKPKGRYGDMFYTPLIKKILDKKDWEKLNEYEDLIFDKTSVAYIYNNYAWNLSGEDLTSPGKDLEFAEKLSKKSLEIINYEKKLNPQLELQGVYNMFADTYALIVYKQGLYDKAFQYQGEIVNSGYVGIGGKERYVEFALKAKGAEFIKEFLEKELLAGANSKVMLTQLEDVYKALNFSENEFNVIKQHNQKIVNKEKQEHIIKTLGDVKSKDFELVNLKGENIKLSDLKGKVVVLDFWATWCGPCKASFPKMQEMVNKYRNKNVEFLFINTWERKKPEETTKDVETFIKDNQYTFNVLFDYKDEVVKNYKIKGIPAKVVIDKKGDVISIKSSYDNLMALIDENL